MTGFAGWVFLFTWTAEVVVVLWQVIFKLTLVTLLLTICPVVANYDNYICWPTLVYTTMNELQSLKITLRSRTDSCRTVHQLQLTSWHPLLLHMLQLLVCTAGPFKMGSASTGRGSVTPFWKHEWHLALVIMQPNTYFFFHNSLQIVAKWSLCCIK